MTHAHTVDILVNQMVNVMEQVPNTSADDVLSAALTLSLRIIKTSIKLGADPGCIQHAVETLMLACADDTHTN